jgi:thiol:disulfide interchange protein
VLRQVAGGYDGGGPQTPGPAGLLVLAALSGCSSPPAPAPPTIVLAGEAPTSSAPPPEPVDAGVPRKRVVTAIAWIDSEPEAWGRARRTGQPLLLWIRAGWDAATLEMERKVWTDPAVIAAARPFVQLRIDMTETDGDAELYAQKYDVQGLPTTLLFAAGGRRVAAFTGMRDPAALADALRAAAAE